MDARAAFTVQMGRIVEVNRAWGASALFDGAVCGSASR